MIPASLSPATRDSYARLLERLAQRRQPPPPTTPDEFAAAAAAREAEAAPFVDRHPDVAACRVAAVVLGGVPALEVMPPDAIAGSALLYVHGGAFTLLSARSTLPIAARLARATRRRVVSVDYTLAPAKRWRAITAELLAAYRAQLNTVEAGRVGMVGDSAGGAIAVSALLQAPGAELPLPGALALLSTVADLTLSGDSMLTLGEQDLILDPGTLRAGYGAYANTDESALPLVSPARATFDAAFPPTQLHVGTRELLLSDSIMLHAAMARGGVDATLHVHEGMPHSFHAALPDSAEATAVYRAVAAWFDRTLAA